LASIFSQASFPDMKTLNRARWIGITTLATMFILGEAALLNPKGNYEWFPFYSWSMFALVPDVERNYLVKVAKPESTAVDFRTAGGLVQNPRSLEAYHLIQRWGRSVEKGDSTEAEPLRQAFEDRYLRPGTRYRLHARTEDPLSLWKERTGKREPDSTAEPINAWRIVEDSSSKTENPQ